MRRAMLTRVIYGLLWLVFVWLAAPVDARAADLFNNFNTYAVSNGVTMGTLFRLPSGARITELVTYHWNYGRGPRPGRVISLWTATGKFIIRFVATGRAGQGGALVNLVAVPPSNFYLPAGTYVIDDDDHATWSQNAGSGHHGFAIVRGTLVTAIPRGAFMGTLSAAPGSPSPTPPPAPSAPSAGWPQTCDTNAGAVAHMVGACTGDWHSAKITVVMLRTLATPITSVSFKFTKPGVANPVTLPSAVLVPGVCSMSAAGSSCTFSVPHELCVGGQYSVWDLYLIDKNTIGQGDIGRYMIGGCP